MTAGGVRFAAISISAAGFGRGTSREFAITAHIFETHAGAFTTRRFAVGRRLGARWVSIGDDSEQ